MPKSGTRGAALALTGALLACQKNAGGKGADQHGVASRSAALLTPAGALAAFASDAAMAAYLSGLSPDMLKHGTRLDGAKEGAAPDVAPAPASPPPRDIAKSLGDSLIVAHGVTLYAMSITAGRPPALTDAQPIEPDPALAGNVTVQDVLVTADTVVVLAKRDALGADPGVDPATPLRGALELDAFKFASGKLTRLGATYLEADVTTAAGAGYSARMVDGTLVVYEPFDAFDQDAGSALHVHLPHSLIYKGRGRFAYGDQVVHAADVLHPLADPAVAAFHVVHRCAAGASGLSCSARALISDARAVAYVSPAAAYVYAGAYVYALPLGDGQITAHRADGAPADGAGMSEANGTLYALTYDAGGGAHLLALPLAAFDTVGAQALDAAADRLIPALADTSPAATRWIGQSLVGIFDAADVKIVDLATGDLVTAPISDAQRIEALDQGRALIMSDADTNLTLSVVALPSGQVLGSDAQSGADTSGMSEHGFFYQTNGDGSGSVGLGVVNDAVAGQTAEALTPAEQALAAESSIDEEADRAPEPALNLASGGYASVAFHSVSAAGRIAPVGKLTSSEAADAACGAACVTTLGDTRPLFVNGRVFALLGGELMEGALANGSLAATGRPLDFEQ